MKEKSITRSTGHTVEAELKKSILVVGSDGLIGNALVSKLEASGMNIMGTTRRKKSVSAKNPFLDLEEDNSSWEPGAAPRAAVICAGVTSLKKCQERRAETEKVNIRGICSLINTLAALNSYVVFISSDKVFDGAKPFPAPDDPVSPATEYGRQKAVVERLISGLGARICVIRFTKVVGPADKLFSEWRKALNRGEVIHPFLDMYISPIPLSFAVSVIERVLDLQPVGVVHASGARDVTYEEAARIGAASLGADPSLIQPVEAKTFPGFEHQTGKKTALNISGLKDRMGLTPPDIEWTIENIFSSPGTLDIDP